MVCTPSSGDMPFGDKKITTPNHYPPGDGILGCLLFLFKPQRKIAIPKYRCSQAYGPTGIFCGGGQRKINNRVTSLFGGWKNSWFFEIFNGEQNFGKEPTPSKELNTIIRKTTFCTHGGPPIFPVPNTSHT